MNKRRPRVRLILASILALALLPSFNAPAFAQDDSQKIAQRLQGFDAYMEKVLKDWNAPGIGVGIVVNDKLVFAKGYGYRDYEKKLPITSKTLFPIASNTKLFTAVAAGFLVEEGKYNAYTDLTQELFVALLSKERFQHYIDTAMTDAEIEAEISQIELTNMLTAELRKRYPESYRLARRISTLIQTGASFKRFDNIGNPEAHRRICQREIAAPNAPKV